MKLSSSLKFGISVLLSVFALQSAPAQTQEENPEDYQLFNTDLPIAEGGGADIEAVESKIFEEANQFRKENGERQIKRNGKLDTVARTFAEYMAETHRYGHTADGRRPSERVAAEDYEYCFVAENIAYEYRSEPTSATALATRLLEGWIESPGHRKNLLSESATETGLGIARSEKSGAYFAVHLFARPKSMAVRFQVANESAEAVRYSLVTEEGSTREYKIPSGATGIHEECLPPKLKLIRSDDSKTVETADEATVRIVS